MSDGEGCVLHSTHSDSAAQKTDMGCAGEHPPNAAVRRTDIVL